MAENSLERMLAVIDLFREGRLEWSPEEMMRSLSYSRSTLYRYLKILVEAGFLSSMPNTGYTLGPRIIELDYLLRKSDPLILSGRPFLLELVSRYPGTAMIVRLFKDKILCVHHEKSSKDKRSSYARGRLMPITRGATGKAILAFLPRTHLLKLIEPGLDDFRRTGFGDTASAVRQKLKIIRSQGFAVAHGEVTAGVYGVAAPIFNSDQAVIASISITIEDRYVDDGRIDEVADHIKFCASVLSKALAERPREGEEKKEHNPII